MDEEQKELSPTLASLENPPETACARCQSSLWLLAGKELKCFCRIMHTLTWSDEEKTRVVICDGEFLAQEEGA